MLILGIEGGTSSSKAVIINEKGELIGKFIGEHTNHWILGLIEASQRIVYLIYETLKNANLSLDTKIDAFGFSLSGVDFPKNSEDLKNTLMSEYPLLFHNDDVFIWNDSIGSMSAASDNGGIVLISGTGSICNCINKDWTFNRVGGMGHHIGDQGSAYWIARKGITDLILHLDGVKVASEDMTKFQAKVFQHFQIDSRLGILTHFYTNFQKSDLAAFAKEISKMAFEGDAFCIRLFYKAGYQLARLVVGASRYLHDPQKLQNLNVLCVGQMFNSWKLLQAGFVDGMKPRYPTDTTIVRFSLLHLKVEAARGAAYLAAQMTGNKLEIDYRSNYDVFFSSSD